MSDWKRFTSTIRGYIMVNNPERKWFQLWKPKYVPQEQPQSYSEYKVEGGKVMLRFIINPTDSTEQDNKQEERNQC